MEARQPTAPQPWPETQAFWEAANREELWVGLCRGTGRTFFYPRAHSPFTGRAEVDLVRASGKGTIYTYSVMVRARPAFCLAYVQLQEGPIVMSNIITDDFDRLAIGQPVTLCFVAADNGQKIPMFKPDDAAG